MGFLILINQLICKFNISVREILEEIYPAVAGRVFTILPRDPFPSGPEGSTEVRSFTMLHLSFTCYANSV